MNETPEPDMPCTFSHPLAVVLFHRLCPTRLNFTALVIGSMSPDFAYYVRQFRVAQFSHTILGTLTVCLPTGLLALCIFYVVRRPLCFILPQPHRAALTPLASVRPFWSMRSLFIAALSVMAGAWTHTIWDSFTHDAGWAVGHIPILHAALIHIGGTALSTSYVLQQLSTFSASAALIVLYLRWLRRQPITPPSPSDSFPDRWRYFLLCSIVVMALALAAPAAYRMASHFEGYTAFRVFIFRTGVYSTAVFFPLLAISSIILDVVHRGSGKPFNR
jgi:small-conductance mechanosensitive channel